MSTVSHSQPVSTAQSSNTAHTLSTVWYTRCPVPTGLGIAIQKGWLQQKFEQDQIEIKSLRESNSKEVRNSHFNHSLENSVRHGGSIPAIWAYSSGQKTKVIGLSWADEAQLLLTRFDANIKTVADLKGKKFGIPLNQDALIDFSRAQAIRGLENALKTVDLTVADVQLVDTLRQDIIRAQNQQLLDQQKDGSFYGSRNPLNASAELVALLTGQVDAIFLKGAQAVQIASDFALHTIIDIGAHPDPLLRSNNGTPRTLTVDEHFLTHHPKQVQHIIESVVDAEQWSHQNPAETHRYLAKECQSTEQWVHVAYGEDAHLKLNTNFDETSIHALQDLSDFLYRWKFIPNPIDVKQWLAPESYQSIQQ
ncbi:ABC transporter substrate-binding protein [Acinetobacter puyangensis]|uniref:2'-hydroxybiphenyl-2-sulfinate desulfinase n=1 Tax=Acinetobacter puyangensis TaxID=1096779 RepID=A0A240ECS2_9GAMM|nr:ABC transporter substrate-binding protein [Acinetobacter puyangensis]SNX45710.1 2'-hydroxybiphenyl-2-sulfinate desulfinase [Acinetobacter puyangensis]